ncbi:MAG: VOC family protein [Fimbriimonadales bacterium]
MSNPMDDHALAAGRTFPWHEVYVADTQAAMDFYTKALGMGTEEMEMGEMGKYKMLTANGKAVAGSMSTKELEHPDVPPHWAVYMAVDDVDARVTKVKELGGTCVVDPFDVPTVGRMALIADPQGAHLWLYKDSGKA